MKKIILLVFLILVIIPVLVFIFKGQYIDLDSVRNNQLNNYLLVVAVIGCGIIFYLSQKQQPPIRSWRTLSAILGLALIVILYLGNSLSHFGF